MLANTCCIALVISSSMCMAIRISRTRPRLHSAITNGRTSSPCDADVTGVNESQLYDAMRNCEEFRTHEIRAWECQKRRELCGEWEDLKFWPHFIEKSALRVEVVRKGDSIQAVPWREFKSADLRFYRGTGKACEEEDQARPMWFSNAHIAKYVYARGRSVCQYKLQAKHVGDENSGGKTLKLLDMSDPASLEFLKTHEITQELMEIGRNVQSVVGDDCARKAKCRDCLQTPPPANKCVHLGAVLKLMGIDSGPQCYWNEETDSCHKPGNVSDKVAVKKLDECAPDKGKDLLNMAFTMAADGGRDAVRRNSFDLIDAKLASLLCDAVRNASKQGDGTDVFFDGYFAFPLLKGAPMLERQEGQPDFPPEAMLCNAAKWLELVGNVQDSDELESVLEQEELGCDESELDACK